MNSDLNKILVETTIRNTMKQIKNDPERSMRNLIDMALHFSEGGFQEHFLLSAQNMLANEQSSYYKLFPDIVSNVDTERIVTFGMNMGYNGCTMGARTIREIEAKEQFNIPWTVSIEISGVNYYENEQRYHEVIKQGRELGIYTWLIYAPDSIPYVIELAEDFPDRAFVIFVSPEAITSALLDEAESVHNIMFAIKYSDEAEMACRMLRSRKFLYSVYYEYGAEDIERIISGDILYDSENMSPAFTVFLAEMGCPQEKRLEVYQYVQKVRNEQIYKTIVYDVVYDNHFIDSIISNQACSVGFTKEGTGFSIVEQASYENCNIFSDSLKDILKKIPLHNV